MLHYLFENIYICNSTAYALKMILLISIIISDIIYYTNAEVIVRTCEPIRVETCIGIGYNFTSMPNLVGHELQTDADFTLQTFQPLIQYGCSSQLHFFLCSAYVPLCTSKVSLPIGPCRSLCESVRARCHPVLQGFGFPWPAALDCNRFPIENNQDHMCMEGPQEPDGGGNNKKNSNNIVDNHNHIDGGGGGGGGTIGDTHLSTSSTKFTLNNLLCENLINSRLYARLNRSGKCAPLCEADILFNKNEKNIAEIWVTSWSVTSLTTAILATICLIISDTKWDKIIMPIVTCHSLVAVGWAVRWLAGRNSTACGFDPQIPGVSILLIDGLSNAPCAVTFLLRYYFGMAANVWWAILCLKWHFTVRRARKDSLNNTPGGDKNKDTFSTITQLAAWGLPALQTISVLVAHLVDADELLGSCYVGNQSYQALRTLVLLPLFCYWSFGTVNILAGYIVYGKNIFSSKSINKNNQNDNNNNNNQNNIINNLQGLGKFLFILWIPSTILLVAVVYEYTFRDVWLKASDSMNGTIRRKDATMWPFMLRAFMEILFCVLSSAWTFGPRFATFWRNKFGRQRHKQTPIKYPNTPTAYSTTSYQTVVCPQNSMVSISKNSSIYKQNHNNNNNNNNNKNYQQHQQHHQHHHTRHQYNQQLSLINDGGGGDAMPAGLPITNGAHHHHHHHHVHRKSRPYKSSAHSIILNGNETTVV